ncbi:MAG: hypothetical protein ABS939_01870 [Psychrobacillus sp.]
MKRLILSSIAVLMCSVLFVVFNPNNTHAEEKENVIVMPKYYDENNVEVEPYSEDEYLEKVNDIIKDDAADVKKSKISLLSSQPKYVDTFGYGEFRNFVWVNKGKAYKNPLYLNLERENRTDGLAVYFYTSGDTYKGKVVFPKYGNMWEVADVEKFLPRGSSYKFKLVSESGELAKVTHGNIGYNN